MILDNNAAERERERERERVGKGDEDSHYSNPSIDLSLDRCSHQSPLRGEKLRAHSRSETQTEKNGADIAGESSDAVATKEMPWGKV